MSGPARGLFTCGAYPGVAPVPGVFCCMEDAGLANELALCYYWLLEEGARGLTGTGPAGL